MGLNFVTCLYLEIYILLLTNFMALNVRKYFWKPSFLFLSLQT